MYFECEKVDLTAEIKISENVLSLFGALYVVYVHCLRSCMAGLAAPRRA